MITVIVNTVSFARHKAVSTVQTPTIVPPAPTKTKTNVVAQRTSVSSTPITTRTIKAPEANTIAVFLVKITQTFAPMAMAAAQFDNSPVIYVKPTSTVSAAQVRILVNAAQTVTPAAARTKDSAPPGKVMLSVAARV